MSYLFCGILGVSILSALLLNTGNSLSPALLEGAGEGVRLGISLAGGLCLWSGAARCMEAAGILPFLTRKLKPVLRAVFPDAPPRSLSPLCGNLLANLLGLGNAATPLGIRAVRQMQDPGRPGFATDSMCRLIVLNTASIQLIPASAAALRGAAGSARPFDILPAIWLCSFCSAGAGLLAAWILGKLWCRD